MLIMLLQNIRAYGVFMSITIPSGEHAVEFIYTPWDVRTNHIVRNSNACFNYYVFE